MQLLISIWTPVDVMAAWLLCVCISAKGRDYAIRNPNAIIDQTW